MTPICCATCLFRITTVHLGKICNNPEALNYRKPVAPKGSCRDYANAKEVAQ